jgi:hypothetical protein
MEVWVVMHTQVIDDISKSIQFYEILMVSTVNIYKLL